MNAAPDNAVPSSPTIVVVTPRHTVHWVIAGLLAIIATILVLRDEGPLGASPAMAQTGMLGARGVFAFTGQIGMDKYGLWMLDIDAGTVWCYEYNSVSRKMMLAAARSFRYDRYLEDFNQDPKTNPSAIDRLLQQQRQAKVAVKNILQGQNSAVIPATSAAPSSGPAASGS